MKAQSKNERTIWAIFANAPGAEALALMEEAQKILVARNLVKAKRTRVNKDKADAAKQN